MKATIQTQHHHSIIASAIQRAMPEQSDQSDQEIVMYERESIRANAKIALVTTIITFFLDVMCIGAFMAVAWSVRALLPIVSSSKDKKTAISQEPVFVGLAGLSLLISGSRLTLMLVFWAKILMH